MPAVSNISSLKHSNTSSPYHLSQSSSQPPPSSPPLSDLNGRCFGKFKVLKYSFTHDKRPTPEGLSAQPVDPFEWSHRIDTGMMLRIYRVDPEVGLPSGHLPTVKIVITKGYSRNPTIMENVSLPLLYSVFSHILNAGNNVFACIARDPVMGFRYLVEQNSELMTFRFQVRLEDSSQYYRAINLLQKLNCPLTMLQSKKSSEPSSEPSAEVPTKPSSINALTKFQQQTPLTSNPRSTTDKISPNVGVFESVPPRPRCATFNDALFYQTQTPTYDSILPQSGLITPHSQSGPLPQVTPQLQDSLDEPKAPPSSVVSVLAQDVGYGSQKYSQPTTVTEASVSLEDSQLHQVMVRGSSSDSPGLSNVLGEEPSTTQQLQTAQRNQIVIGGSIYSLVPVQESNQTTNSNLTPGLNNVPASIVSTAPSLVPAVEPVFVTSVPSAPAPHSLSISDRTSSSVSNSFSAQASAVVAPLSTVQSPAQIKTAASPQSSHSSSAQNSITVRDDSAYPLSQTPPISSLIHSVLSSRTELVQRPSLQIQQRIRQIINEPDFWRLVHDIEKQWHILTKGI